MTVDEGSAPAPLRFNLSTWGELETVFGADLNESRRGEIMEALDQYVVASHFRAIDAARSKLRGSTTHTTSVKKLRGRIERVLESWGGKRDKRSKQKDRPRFMVGADKETMDIKATKKATLRAFHVGEITREEAVRELHLIDDIEKDMQDAQALRRLLQDVSDDFGLGDIAETMEHLHNINRHLDRYLSAPQYAPFPRYVARIAAVFKSATGEPARVAIPTDASISLSKFVAVIKALNKTLPHKAHRNVSTDAAWSQAVYRAIHDTK